jgi:hypothetical protein
VYALRIPNLILTDFLLHLVNFIKCIFNKRYYIIAITIALILYLNSFPLSAYSELLAAN